MSIYAGTRGSTAVGLALCAFVVSCDSKPGIPSPTPTLASSAPSASTQATCESLDTLAAGVVIRIGPPPASSYQPPLMDIAAHSLTWTNGSMTSNGEAITENTAKAGGSGI